MTVGQAGDQAAATPQGGDGYKWVALANTTLGVVMATINSSIMLVALPDVFRGISLDPLQPGNSFYLLWMILGFLVVSSVLVVSLGRLGDMYGRVKMYNLGFAIYTVSSLFLTITWLSGDAGAMYLVVMRIFQGIGAAFIVANSAAILTDAFPPTQRGLALGINNVAAISGSFIGLVLGGVLGAIDWRLIFLVSVPFGLAGTLWAYFRLREMGVPMTARFDWAGNLTFGIGLVLVMIGITYGIQPYAGHAMGWTSPAVDAELAVGLALLLTFAVIETRVTEPMFRLRLFRIRAFRAGVLSSFLSALARGGMMFMLIIWLQGIWLPEHGYSFESTPLWAGIFMLPLTAGFLLAGPLSGLLSDRFGARPFATGGMIGAAISFGLLEVMPLDFPYWAFGLILLMNGLSMGAFAAPNRAAVMNTLPPQHRGGGGGMQATFQNSAQVLSIGIFFSLVIVSLSASLPGVLDHGLVTQGVPAVEAARVAHQPPIEILFSAFLGYNPIAHLLPASFLGTLPQAAVARLTSHSFFAGLISEPFGSGLHVAFDLSLALCLAAAAASWSSGGRDVHAQQKAGYGTELDAFRTTESTPVEGSLR